MGGYNTFCEILSFDKRALIVPRTAPRMEQIIRASPRAEELGLVTHAGRRRRPRRRRHGGGAAPSAAAAAAVRRGRCPACSTACRSMSDRLADAIADGARRRAPPSGCPIARRSGDLKPAPWPLAVVVHPEGLSAAVGNLHRPGDPRPGAARPRHPRSSRCASPTDRTRPSGPSRDRGAGRLSAGISVWREPLRVLARVARRRGACPAIARPGASGCATCGATRRANRGRRFGQAWCWPPSCRTASDICTPISCTRRPRSRAMPR